MISKEYLDIAQQEASRLFSLLAGPVEGMDVRADDEGAIVIDVKLAEPRFLIGERGQTLTDIQHILRSMVRKKTGESFYILLDINSYKKNKEQYLREMAKTVADEVSLLKKEQELAPMSAADRRIVHVELAERSDVESESIGEGASRRVKIKPKR